MSTDTGTTSVERLLHVLHNNRVCFNISSNNTTQTTQYFDFVPEKFKEYLVEYFFHDEGFEDKTFGAQTNIFEGFMLDPELLDGTTVSDCGLPFIIDETAQKELRREMLHKVMGIFVEGINNDGERYKKLMQDSTFLLREELMERNVPCPQSISPESLVLKPMLSSSITNNVQARLVGKARHGSFHMNQDLAIDPGSSYQVRLMYLVGGDGLNLVDLNLWFEYTTIFEELMFMLRMETSLCTKQKYEDGTKEEGGWELKDGPWLYKIVKDKQTIGEWEPLHDEESYGRMLKSMKENDEMATIVHVSKNELPTHATQKFHI
jgi:hypothetical protein